MRARWTDLEDVSITPRIAQEDFIRYAELLGDPQQREKNTTEKQSLKVLFELSEGHIGYGVEQAHVGMFGIYRYRSKKNVEIFRQYRDREVVMAYQHHARYCEGRELSGDIFGAVIAVRKILREVFPLQTAF